MKTIIGYFAVCLICITNTLFAQYSNKSINNVSGPFMKQRIKNIRSLKLSIFKVGTVDLTTYLPANYSKSGNIDYTKYIQKGINENKRVMMPNFPILINSKGLKLKSNSSILFQEKSLLKLESNNMAQYGVIWVDGVNNVNIYCPNILGDKYKHLSKKGQWGMGIFITGSRNINIYKPFISKMWGDGIYIGQVKNLISSEILINGGILNDNRRNGISIVSGRNITITDCFISNTSGVSPSGGIDIEPNDNSNELRNLSLNNITTFNNGSRGILIALDYLNGAIEKNISIAINNHKDSYSPVGLEIYSDRGNGNKHPNYNKGVISVNGAHYRNNKKAGFYSGVGKRNEINLKISNIISDNSALSSSKLQTWAQQFKKGVEIKTK